LGPGAAAFWQGCLEGVAQWQPIPDHWEVFTPYITDAFSPLPDIEYKDFGLGRVEQLYYDPSVLNLLVACREALENAAINVTVTNEKSNSLSIPCLDTYQTGVFMGSGNGGINSLLENYRHFLLNKLINDKPQAFPEDIRETLKIPKRFNKFVTAREMPNAVAAGVAIKYGIKGIVKSAHYACSSSTVSIGDAFEAIQGGRLQMALAGGTEYATDHLGSTMCSFDVAHALGSLVDGRWRGPYDKRSNGFLFSEGGAGVLVLESEESVYRRGVEPIAEVIGYGTSFDAFNIMAPDESGLELKRLISNVCASAGIEAEKIDYINAHGTGTKNDVNEIEVFNGVMPQKPAVNSTKSIIGHTLGASGALETIISALSLKHQTVHKSAGIEEPLEGVNLVRETSQVAVDYCLKISSAFGGHNAGLLLKRVQ